ncbi:MAG: DUF4202 domain-containing protein [Bacteroidota bacterium]
MDENTTTATLNKFQQAILRFDELNSADPNIVSFEGRAYPKEVLYGQRMSSTLVDFAPNASEALQLAARCQHLCRWEIPRGDYPKGRVGYNQWRNTLKKLHAQKAGEVLQSIGYEQAIIDRVQFLVQKKQLKRDEETQTLEDVICLVFLTYYFNDFAASHPDEKVIDILRKTWRKMSKKGQAAALELPLSEKGKVLVGKALGGK